MTTRGRGRRSVSRAPKPPMYWFSNANDLATLAGNTSITFPMLTAGVIPEAYLTGMTILRLIVKVYYAANAVAEIVNAVNAIYVGTRGSAATPPNLVADSANYYYLEGLSIAASPAVTDTKVLERDIRSKRRIRGEDTDLFWRVTNLETTSMQVGMDVRMLLQLH